MGFPVVPTPSPSMVDDCTAPSLAVNPLLFADVLPLSVAVPDIYNDTFDSPPPIVIGDMAGLHGIGGIIIGGGGGGGGGGGDGGGGGGYGARSYPWNSLF